MKIGKISPTKIIFPILTLLMLVSSAAFAQLDPSGEWNTLFHEDQLERVPGPEVGDYLGLPINAAARMRANSWQASLLEIPEEQCRPHASDYAWRGPGPMRIWQEVDRMTQQVLAYHEHFGAYGNEMTIYMDGRPHPPDYAPHTWEGFSTGKWEGDSLAVTTTHLREGWLRRNGMPRSELATVSTHFMRHDNYLTIMIVIYDPAYLTEPFPRSTDYVLAPAQVQIAPWPCEAVDEVDNPPGRVPSHLPGTNTYITEFPAAFGIPLEAAQGGADTMYPEYMKKMATMPKLPKKAPAVQ
jgi:hypothetical protein